MEIRAILGKHQPDGIFASDDLTAILIMKMAEQIDSDYAQKLKVVGYDGTTFIEHYFPQLTTIRQPLEEIAKLLVDVLLKKIDGQATQKDYILPVQLINAHSL